ncbi:hypothetical protein SRABI128_05668 [Microbacterium sp. Bi128]|nr:hypothetical protein SRABI128_05668 [Microbacterium sp. Bi128]
MPCIERVVADANEVGRIGRRHRSRVGLHQPGFRAVDCAAAEGEGFGARGVTAAEREPPDIGFNAPQALVQGLVRQPRQSSCTAPSGPFSGFSRPAVRLCQQVKGFRLPVLREPVGQHMLAGLMVASDGACGVGRNGARKRQQT